MAEPGQARVLASGSLAQQAAQVTGLVAMFAIVTVLARRLSLGELGAFGLLSSLAGYLLIVQNAAAGAAVRSMAAAGGRSERDAAFSTAAVVYAVAGFAAGAVVAGLGAALVSAVDLSPAVAREARLGALLLGAVTAVGWPATVYRDALRARQLFVRAALTEVVALLAYVALVVGLAEAGASLALVIGASGTIPLLAGAGCAGVARASRIPFRLRPSAVSRRATQALLGLAGTLSLAEAAAAAIYAVNRAILGLFRSAAVVGLYEGPVRAHNLLRALNGAVTVTALPTASRYHAAGDVRRLRELVLRGSRYTLALIVPIAVTGMVLSGPILEAWLGEVFRQAGPTMTIMLAHWVVNGCAGVLGAVLVGTGRAWTFARWATAVGAGNVVLALALTPLLGLEGVALATAVPYLALFPYLAGAALRSVDLRAEAFLRGALVPAWAVGGALAAGLGALRLAVDVEGPGAVAAAAFGGLAVAWTACFALVLRREERRLVRDVARGFTGAGWGAAARRRA